MLNDQVIGLLQNNAGNPDIVRRIAEENQLSQAEIAQALRIPEGSAARYMPGMNPEQGMEAGSIDGGMVKPAPMPTPMATKPGMQPPQVPTVGGASVGMAGGGASPAIPAANAASQALLPTSPAGGGNVQRVGDTYAGMVSGGGLPAAPAGAPQVPTTGIPAAPAIGSRPADMGMIKPDMGTTKPAKLPADMKPQGLRGEFRQVRPPSTTAIPEDEMAFTRGFERVRGARA